MMMMSEEGDEERYVIASSPATWLRNEGDNRAAWVPDEIASHCMVDGCTAEFGFFLRRHHCRMCGRVVCHSCSKHQYRVSGYGKAKQRVCDECSLAVEEAGQERIATIDVAILEQDGSDDTAGSKPIPSPHKRRNGSRRRRQSTPKRPAGIAATQTPPARRSSAVQRELLTSTNKISPTVSRGRSSTTSGDSTESQSSLETADVHGKKLQQQQQQQQQEEEKEEEEEEVIDDSDYLPTVSANVLFNMLSGSVLVVDTRSRELFEQSHVPRAINIPVSNDLVELYKQGRLTLRTIEAQCRSIMDRQAFGRRKLARIVVYDDVNGLDKLAEQVAREDRTHCHLLQYESDSSRALNRASSDDDEDSKVEDADQKRKQKKKQERDPRQHGDLARLLLHALPDDESFTPAVILARLLQLEERAVRSSVLQGGFAAFASSFPYATCQYTSTELRQGCHNHRSVFPWYPTLVEPAFLFVGNHVNAAHEDSLRDLGVTVIINVTADVGNHFAQNSAFEYMNCVVEDDPKADIAQFFQPVYDKLLECESHGKRVLIHSRQGVSRAPTIVLAYLMMRYRWTLRFAFEWLRTRRRQSSPNDGFWAQLTRVEGSCSLR
eukprot:TRINITY_DN66283_c7_g6_i1.p1 TRINITY_DN66283_c7_g6~~TRINITY_DN66283_c7_g6_i1.p1  ORF type:complete len:624 (+),score=268.65 TRINITY_DN66283_c7_g6_i1:55-1872(+)